MPPFMTIPMHVVVARKEITTSLRIMSRFVEDYHDLQQGFTLDPSGTSVSFMEFIEKWHHPPTDLLTPSGKLVPLYGLIEMIAVGRVLADTDILGGNGMNGGFVWVKNGEEIIAARAVKIDPGCAFNFTHDPNESRPSPNWVINTRDQLCEGRMLNHIKDLQVAQNNHKVTLYWSDLTDNQKDAFLSTLYHISYDLENEKILNDLFYRGGKFYKDELTEFPEEIAKTFQHDMREWLCLQLDIYAEDIEQFFHRVLLKMSLNQ